MATPGHLEVWDDPERERLRAELAAVTEELAGARLELADLTTRLAGFTHFHDRLLAPLYAELDQVRAEIAAVLAARSGRPDDQADAEEAWAQARESAAAAEEATERPDEPVDAPPRPPPTDLVRGLYRALVKLCHPDLAVDETERQRRQEFTIRVNDAYADDDAARLEELAREWHSGTAPETADPRAAIAAARARLAEVRAHIDRLGRTILGALLVTSADPHAEVQRLADQVRAEIRRQREVLDGLR